MNKRRYDYYMRFTDAEVEERLNRRRMLFDEREKMIEAIKEHRATALSALGKRRQLKKLWGELLSPAKRERHVCGLIIKQIQRKIDSGFRDEGQEKVRAVKAYCLLIEQLLAMATQCEKVLLLTPGQKAKQPTKAFPNGLPNNGIHWTDWVSASRKNTIRALFNEIPHRSGVKCKVPFERKIPKIIVMVQGMKSTLFEEQRLRLLERTIKELEHAQKSEALNPTEAGGQRIYKMREAIAWLHNCDEGEPIPPTWHGIFKDRQ
jgi:hypothetical protein